MKEKMYFGHRCIKCIIGKFYLIDDGDGYIYFHCDTCGFNSPKSTVKRKYKQ